MSLGPLDPFNPPWAVPLDTEGFSGLVAEGDSTFSQASEAIDHPPLGVVFSSGLSLGFAGKDHDLPPTTRGVVTHTRRAIDAMAFEHISGRYGAAVYGGHVAEGTSVQTGRKDLTGPGIRVLVAAGRVEIGAQQSTRPSQERAVFPVISAARAHTRAAHEVTQGAISGAQVTTVRAHEHAWAGVLVGRPFSQVSGYHAHVVMSAVLWGSQLRSYRALGASASMVMGHFYGAHAVAVGSVPVEGSDGIQHVFEAFEATGAGGVVWGLCVPPHPPFKAHIHDFGPRLSGTVQHTQSAHEHPTLPSMRGRWIRHPFLAHEHVLSPMQSGASQHGRAAMVVDSDVWMGPWTRAYNAQVVTGHVVFSPKEPGRPTLRQGHEHHWPSPDFAQHVRTYTAQDLESYHVVFHVRRLRPQRPPVVPHTHVREIEAQKAGAAAGIEKFGVAVYYKGKK